MANYIEKKDFNEEMLKCIEAGKLTNRSVEMFHKLATEVSRRYNFKYAEEREDAISSALHDFASYWGGYKYKPVYNIVLTRNFEDGEKISVTIPNLTTGKSESCYFIARIKPSGKYDFLIGDTENRSLESLSNLINSFNNIPVTSTIHKVTRKITLIDKLNDVGTYGTIEIDFTPNKQLVKTKKFIKGSSNISDEFYEPSSAFNWATSVAINGIIKSMDKMRPKDWRNGKMVNFSELTGIDGEIYGF